MGASTQIQTNMVFTPDTDLCARPHRGGTKDAHGCVAGGGYQWSASEKKCLRPWEHPEAFETASEKKVINTDMVKGIQTMDALEKNPSEVATMEHKCTVM